MRRSVVLLVGLVACAAIGGTAALAVGQSQSTAASGFATGQSSTLTVPSSAGATNVPGYAGDASNLQSYATNPTGLQNAGAAAAASNDPLVGLTNKSLDNRNASAIDLNADWLKSSLSTSIDPYSMVKDSQGTQNQQCETKTKTATTSEKSIYSCETGRDLTQTTSTCKSTLIVDTTTTNTYECKTTWNASTQSWDVSSQCTALASANCQKGGTNCTTPSTPTYTTQSCSAGTSYSTSYQSCQITTTTSTSSYSGTCYNTLNTSTGQWSNGCSSLGSNCSTGSSQCSAMNAPTFQDFSCEVRPASTTSRTYQCGAYLQRLPPPYGSFWITDLDCPIDPGCYVSQQRDVGPDMQIWTYTCVSGEPAINTCASYSGCQEVSSTCGDAQCRLQLKTYRCQTGSGSCSQYATNYTCSTTSTSTSNGCSSLEGSGCSVSSSSTSGNTTTRTYACTSASSVNTCSGLTGCNQTGSSCAGYAPGGGCSLYNYTYQCPKPDPSGGCAVKTTTYTCTGTVPAAGNPTSSTTTQTGSHWEAGACAAASDNACTSSGTTCTGAGGTRTVNGVTATADCWEKTTSYLCTTGGATANSCQVPEGCTKQSDTCLDDACNVVDHVYSCVKLQSSTTTETVCNNQMCLGDSCFTLSQDKNNELPQTFAQLAVMNQAGKNYAADLSVFKGQPLRCRKAIFGFRNCCKDSGWGISLGLAQCDDQEKTLMQKQDAKATHYVGTYCSNKSLFGVCLEKAMSYCGFEGSLGRIVQEAGRTQLGKSWGSAKTPDCSGFTVDEFQQLDLSNVDFSDFYADKMKSLTGPDTNSTVNRIQNSINNLYGNQANPNGGL